MGAVAEADGMNMRRRSFLHLAALAAAFPALPRSASALDYPTRPVRIVAGFAAGGGVDITARLIGQWLTEHLGQSFVTENRPGAGGGFRQADCGRNREVGEGGGPPQD